MYDPKSMCADDFIDHQEILDTLSYADEHKSDVALIDSIIAKAKERKGLSHRDASVLLACDIEEKNQEIYALAEQIKKDFDETLPKCVRMTEESVEALPALHKFCGKAMRLIAPLM